MQKALSETKELRKLLNERVKLADAPEAIWHDAEEVFAEIEASFSIPFSNSANEA